MALPAFDSHKFVKKFTASGFDEKQSEVLVELALESQRYNFDTLATKDDIKSVRKDMQTMEDKLRQEIKTASAETKNSILLWIVPLLSANTLALIGLYAQSFFK